MITGLSFLMSLSLTLVGVVLFVMAIKLTKKDKSKYSENHALSNDFSTVVRGSLKPVGKAGYNGQLSKGLVYDQNTGELTPCAQLSRESLL